MNSGESSGPKVNSPRYKKSVNGIQKKSKFAQSLQLKEVLFSSSETDEEEDASADTFEEMLKQSVRMIGPLTEAERLQKVMHYLQKKRGRQTSKQHVYQCRKKVAESRLRIKGRFVTKP